ncbi:MAG TPA: response regulator transcription factor [Anaerolineae bacterium]|nr:response regulator transcription factor [Anaerolineae bacterium]
MPQTILAVDDDPAQIRLIQMTLMVVNYHVLSASNGEDGVHLFEVQRPDLVVLDVMMPVMDGWEVCSRIRQTSTVPIIFLTARQTTDDKVSGLKIGADDYLIKPFHPDDLLARVEAVLRRTYGPRQPLSDLLPAGPDILINRERREVFVRGDLQSLRPTEFALLVILAERAGVPMSASDIATALNIGQEHSAERVKWHVWKLRKSIEIDPDRPSIILTETGQGYRLVN